MIRTMAVQTNVYRAAALRWGPVALLLGVSFSLVIRSIWGKEPASAPERIVRSRVKEVYSGHSVKLKPDHRAMYAGIRAPYEDEPLFEESRRRNAELVQGKKVRLRFDKVDRDKKGRLYPYVFVDGDFINERLVREGLAYARVTSDTQRFAAELLAAQAEARRAKRGLWKHQTKDKEKRYPADPKYGNFHRPSCEEAPKIKPPRRVLFKSRRAALDAGFAPCRHCQP